MTAKTPWTERDLELVIGKLLRTGVIVAAAWVLAGGALYLIQRGRTIENYRVFQGEPAHLRRIPEIAKSAFSWDARGLMQFGLLLLIVTPIARVAFSVVGFGAERDWLYVLVTLIVLGILLYSLTGT
ncbi:MAG: DUF1634 domain-containing protein [Candidatus Acidiferrales bacterium]